MWPGLRHRAPWKITALLVSVVTSLTGAVDTTGLVSGGTAAGALSQATPRGEWSQLQASGVDRSQRYPFSSKSIWQMDISTAPVDSRSGAMVRKLAGNVADRYNGVAALNTMKYSNSYYVVDGTTPRVTVSFDDCQKKGYVPTGLFDGPKHFVSVPVPLDAVPAEGSDGALSVYSPSSDQLWEFWRFSRGADGKAAACWGGRIDQVSKSLGTFSGHFGATASGLAHSGGMLTIEDAQRRRVDHAIALSIPEVASSSIVRWPAQRSDGDSKNPDSLPEGTRLRLDPSVDVDSLKLNPIAAAMAKGGQKYGFIVIDKGGAVAVSTEGGGAIRASTGIDPWKGILGSTPSYSVMKGFPWDKLQVIDQNFGRP